MSTVEAEQQAVSELQGQLNNFMSPSQAQILAGDIPTVPNVMSYDYLQKHNSNQYGAGKEGAMSMRQQRKNVASANIYGRRYDNARGISSAVSDSMSQPDFSIGRVAVEVPSSSGPGTAAGTDSVRPVSFNNNKMSSVKGIG